MIKKINLINKVNTILKWTKLILICLKIIIGCGGDNSMNESKKLAFKQIYNPLINCGLFLVSASRVEVHQPIELCYFIFDIF